MRVPLKIVPPDKDSMGYCAECIIAMEANDNTPTSTYLQDGSPFPPKPYPGDKVMFTSPEYAYQHMLEHQRRGHEVPSEAIKKTLELTRLSPEVLTMIRKEITEDPTGIGYEGKSVQDQWHLFNNVLIPLVDEHGNRLGYTSRANILLPQEGVRFEDVVMALY